MKSARRCALLCLFVLLSATPVLSQDPAEKELINYRLPLSAEVWVPCAANGEGEAVSLSGVTHVTVSSLQTPSGALHLSTLVNPQGVTGVGAKTGTLYHGVGVTRVSTTLEPGATTADFSFVNVFQFIGVGVGNDLRVRQRIHIVIGPNGTVSVSIERFRVTCR